jgi:hypothetical protein
VWLGKSVAGPIIGWGILMQRQREGCENIVFASSLIEMRCGQLTCNLPYVKSNFLEAHCAKTAKDRISLNGITQRVLGRPDFPENRGLDGGAADYGGRPHPQRQNTPPPSWPTALFQRSFSNAPPCCAA